MANCRLGKRALKFRDWGKVAATFVDLQTGRAVRIAAKESSKQAAREMFPELGKDAGQQKAYAQLSDEILFDKQWVKVEVQPEDLPGFKGPRVVCTQCGEGINFKREVVKDGRTLCRACAGEKYYVPVSCVALAFLLLSFGSLAHAQQASTANNGHSVCEQYARIKEPVSDLPTPKDHQTLASCDSYQLYFGFDRAPDLVKARKCAYLEREAGKKEPDVVFGSAGLLAMIYANGKGADRNFDLAAKFACEVSEGHDEGRVQHLLDLKRQHWAGNEFNLCDDDSSSFMQGWCSRLDEDFKQADRTRKLSAITARWTASEKTAFRELQKAATSFFEASSTKEVDLSGSGRASFEIEAEASLNDDFLAELQQFEKGQFPKFSATDFSKADAELNSIYSKIQSDPKHNLEEFSTVTADGVKTAQRAWLRYREAWVKFGKLKYPTVGAESWRTWLTQERIKMLKELA